LTKRKKPSGKPGNSVMSLACHPGETYNIRLKTGKDPGDCAESEIKDIRKRFLE
jgi:hypothetical protein